MEHTDYNAMHEIYKQGKDGFPTLLQENTQICFIWDLSQCLREAHIYSDEYLFVFSIHNQEMHSMS